MSRHAVGSALEAMQDDKVRERFAAGDFEPGESGQLDEHEQELVQAAANDYPEVLPFFTLIETQTNIKSSSEDNLVPAVQLPAVQSALVVIANQNQGWSAAYSYALGTTN